MRASEAAAYSDAPVRVVGTCGYEIVESARTKGDGMHGYGDDKAKVLARLRRIEGQVRAIEQMVEGDRYCIDVLTQISASTSALKSVALLLLDDHLNHCVRQAAADGGEVADEKLAEASGAIARLVRS
ncbi:transcriptional regulator [Bifidobacterium samirii]|uniref:Transcriptional regulator n=2 Tax=Bifidobacterium samirii TaxID=2306974 RepID=A0A430FW86_9BIFI|nr:transcriptional regulator [Bifidobacterium samirii]